MARPSATLRLRDLDPSAVAAEITECVTAHVARLAFAIDAQLVPIRLGDTSTLGYTTQLLVGYAQRGLGATDWPDHSCADDAIQSVCEALYSQAGEPGFGLGDLASEVDATDAIGVVLLAAHARVHISRRGRHRRRRARRRVHR